MEKYQVILEFDKIYHIYNKAVGNEKLFRRKDDYKYFLKKFDRFIYKVANVFAYCLIPNHFHYLLEIKSEEEISQNLADPSKPNKINNIDLMDIKQTFSNFFNSYTRSYNNVHSRYGKLFVLPYKRILVEKEDYITTLICYIHSNPVHHGLTSNYKEFQHSSFKILTSNEPTKLLRERVMELFGGYDKFIKFHQENIDDEFNKDYFLE